MSASMNYILIYGINLATALIGCQAHSLKGMHNSSVGREATEAVLHGPEKEEGEKRGRGRERR